jgi:hypothetical protein
MVSNITPHSVLANNSINTSYAFRDSMAIHSSLRMRAGISCPVKAVVDKRGSITIREMSGVFGAMRGCPNEEWTLKYVKK